MHTRGLFLCKSNIFNSSNGLLLQIVVCSFSFGHYCTKIILWKGVDKNKLLSQYSIGLVLFDKINNKLNHQAYLYDGSTSPFKKNRMLQFLHVMLFFFLISMNRDQDIFLQFLFIQGLFLSGLEK
jgi:hypothetical protein